MGRKASYVKLKEASGSCSCLRQSNQVWVNKEKNGLVWKED